MKDEHQEQLEKAAAQCDRAIVRLTMKQPKSLDLSDIGYVTSSLASARDALRWAKGRTK